MITNQMFLSRLREEQQTSHFRCWPTLYAAIEVRNLGEATIGQLACVRRRMSLPGEESTVSVAAPHRSNFVGLCVQPLGLAML